MVIISRAGSHAGRGFHFQDAIGVWLVVKSWGDGVLGGEIIPEGRDDYEIRNGESLTLAQVKSRRQHLGAFSVSEAAEFVRALWLRSDKCCKLPDEFILILERPLNKVLATNYPIEDHIELSGLLNGDPHFSHFATRTRVLIVPSPFEETLELIASTLPCPPLSAQVHYGELLQRVGSLADANGLCKVDDFQGLTVSDVEAIFRRLEPLLDADEMEAALRNGYCDPVDFLTPILDSTAFYQGVDARPGHVAAGLIIERVEAREMVISALESKGATLIIGQSGSGKSALMWESARASRHLIRWFEIKKGDLVDAHLFIRLARSLRASTTSPVGFVLDDVGLGLSALWDGLVREVDRASGILLLGSMREEDVFLLGARSRAIELRPIVDDVVAECVWRQLKEQGQTSWAGWKEPWSLSQNLLLEYAHILTRGSRLINVLGEQIDRRLKEERDFELSILRISSLAGSAGATIDIEKLEQVLCVNHGELARALRRLVDEHLIATPVDGKLKGLHQLRSKAIFELTHVNFPHVLSQSIKATTQVVSNSSLEVLIAHITVNIPNENELFLGALAERLQRESSASLAIAIFSGLGQAHIELTLRKWIIETQAFGLEPTQVTLAVMFAVAETSIDNLPLPERLKNSIQALRTRSTSDPRLALLPLITLNTFNALMVGITASQLHLLLRALVGIPLPENLRAVLSKASPNLSELGLPAAADLLSTVALVDRDIAISWADNNVEKLLACVPNEIPWAGEVFVETAPEGRLLHSRIFNVACSVQNDVHGDVVSLCQILFGIDPTANVVAVDAIDVAGNAAGLVDFPIATKRILRESLPPPALPNWNKRWSATAAALVGTESISAYLETGKKLLDQLVPLLEKIVDNMLRRKTPSPTTLERINGINQLSRKLTPPKDERIIGTEAKLEEHASPLQDVLFNGSTEVINQFVNKNLNNSSFIFWTKKLLEQIQLVRQESWDLIGDSPEKSLKRIESIIEGLRLIAVDASTKDVNRMDLWLSAARGAYQSDALRVVLSNTNKSLDLQADSYKHSVVSAFSGIDHGINIHFRPNWEAPIPWPNLEVLLIVDLQSPEEWHNWIEKNSTLIRDSIGEHRYISIIPRINGLLVKRFSIGGIAKFSPSLDKIDNWIESLNLPVLEDTFASAWAYIIDLMVELDGIKKCNLAIDGRSLIEENHRVNLELKLHQALNNFEKSTENMDIQYLPRSFSQKVTDGEIALAESVAVFCHGDITPTLITLNNIMNDFIKEDLLMSLAPRRVQPFE